MKKILALILSVTLIMGVGGCTSNNSINNSTNNSVNNSNSENKDNEEAKGSNSEIEKLADLLGENSEKIIDEKGNGTRNTYEKDGKEYLSTLIYTEKLLDYDIEAAFNFDEKESCTGITVNFSSGSNEEIVKSLKEILGDPSSEETKKGENGESYMVNWTKGNVEYSYIYSMGSSSINIYNVSE